MNDLAALLGGGAAPAAPLPSSPVPGPDPLAAALMGGGAPVADPAMGAAPAPGFASTDPAFVESLLGQLLAARQADHALLDQRATETLLQDPLMEALMSGAPLGPGAGQDAQAIGIGSDIAPAPADMGLAV